MSKLLAQPYDVLPDLTDPTLVGAWLNKAVRGTPKDYSVNGNDGTVVGRLDYDIAGAGFDGTNDAMGIGTDSVLKPTTAMTLVAWIKNRDAANAEIINYRMEGAGAFSQQGMYQITDESVIIQLDDGGTGEQEVAHFDSPLSSNIWTRVGLLFSKADTTLWSYINGDVQADAEATGDFPLAAFGATEIGLIFGAARDSALLRPANVILKDVQLYNAVKSPSWMAHDFLRAVPE